MAYSAQSRKIGRVRRQSLSVDELRERIGKRLEGKVAFSQGVYSAQPLLMTASQLKTLTPPEISKARALARREDLASCGVARLFLEQARLLAGYEDDYEYKGTFSHYFPTYQDMNNEQLRGYFAWRTRVRRGDVSPAGLSFAYLYMYELVNLVGVESPEEGHGRLKAFAKSYCEIDGSIRRYADLWLDDFVIYYDLPREMLSASKLRRLEDCYLVLKGCDEADDDAVYESMCALASADPVEGTSVHARQLRHLSAFAYRAASSHHAKLSTPLLCRLFKEKTQKPYSIFSRAVFADPLHVTTRDFALSPIDLVFCRQGSWWRERHYALDSPSLWLGRLLKTAEMILAQADGEQMKVPTPICTRYLVKALEQEASRIVCLERDRKEREVHIDLKGLGQIRAASERTCERLIVEEEPQAEPFDGSSPESMLSSDADAGTLSSDASDAQPSFDQACGLQDGGAGAGEGVLLDAPETELLKGLLEGRGANSSASRGLVAASVLAESINEKLYDIFADIVIDSADGKLSIIEDYREELERMI